MISQRMETSNATSGKIKKILFVSKPSPTNSAERAK